MSSDDNVGEAGAAVAGQLPENTVEYMLFVIDSQQTEARKTRPRLENIRKAAVELAQSFTKEYIWQREGFEISFKSENGKCPILLWLQLQLSILASVLTTIF
jgi:hypothetical protein